VNRNVLDNPKVRILRGDAREILAVTRERYDVIFSEPSNPYRAGVASLYTRENYEAALDRLTDDGLFLQWVQAYEVDARTVRTIYATIASVFPYVESWQAKEQDLILIGSRSPRAYDVDALKRRIAMEPFASALRVAWRVDDVEGLFAHYLARPEFARAVAFAEAGRVNTDDRAYVEFGFATSLGKETAFDMAKISARARARNEDRPPIGDLVLDWDRVEYERASLGAVEGGEPHPSVPLSAEWRKRIEMQTAYASGNFLGAHTAWTSGDKPRVPETPIEESIVAEVATHMSDPRSRGYIDRLRVWNPTEADGLLAIALVHEGQLEAAAGMFESAFTRYREDPWPLNAVMYRVLIAADDLSSRMPALSRRLIAALEAPFAVDALDHERKMIILSMTRRLEDDHDACLTALAPFEPNPVWTESFLTYRIACYARAGSPFLDPARDDYARFVAHSPFPFDRGL
jgi:hypothetical protein